MKKFENIRTTDELVEKLGKMENNGRKQYSAISVANKDESRASKKDGEV